MKWVKPMGWRLILAGLAVQAGTAQADWNVSVATASSNGAWSGANPDVWTPSATGATVAASEIDSRLNAGTPVIITTVAGTGAEAGKLTVSTGVDWSATMLRLRATGDIDINAPLNGSGTAGLALEYGQGAVAAGNTSTYNVNAPVNLASTGSFSTKLGSDGAVKNYTILTTLGAAGSVTGTDLQGMNGNLAGNYVLGANIDASATSGWNGGAGFAPVMVFTGTFDGLGHSIDGLYINRPSTPGVGLFGAVSGGALRNVALTGTNITGKSSVGGLAGSMNGGTVIRGSVAGAVSGTGTDSFTHVTMAGGVIGYLYGGGTVSGSHADVAVNGLNAVGGLAGYIQDGSVSGCYATGAATGSGANAPVGGLVGWNQSSGSIASSYATGAVSGTNAGGLAGWNMGTIANSYWDTGTTGQAAAVSFNNGTLTNLTGLATADAYTQANYANLDFTNTWWMSDGSTRPFLRSEWTTSITNVHQLQLMAMNLSASYTLANDIDASSTATSGGMWRGTGFQPVGNGGIQFSGNFDGQNHTISGLFINRPGTLSAMALKGLFGWATGSLSNVGLLNSNITGGWRVGTLAGRSDGTISNSYALGGSVTASYYEVGGLVGRSDGSINNSYAALSVTGDTAGGLVGNLVGSLDNSYAAGTVSGVAPMGGLVGMTTGTVTGSFWDKTVAPIDNGIGTGKTTAEMKSLATFDGAGWDIDAEALTSAVWRIYEGNTYPLLRGFLTPLNVTANDASKTYDGVPYSGGNGVRYSRGGVPVVPNANLLGTLTYGGSAQGAVDVDSYVIRPGGFYSSQRGYDIAYTDGALTISAAPPLSYTAPVAAGTGNATATITGGSGCVFTTSAFVPLSTIAAAPPAGVSFPLGLFDFALSGCTVGATVTVSVAYPYALPAGAQYWKYGPTPGNTAPHWYTIPSTIAGNTITFTVTDGGMGDDDLLANGSIADAGGPGIPDAGINGVPTLSEWALVMLSGLLMLAGRKTMRPGKAA